MTDPRVAARLRLALDMYEFGEQMQRARLHREDLDATEAEIDDRVRAWRRHRPGAPLGDAIGRPTQRFA